MDIWVIPMHRTPAKPALGQAEGAPQWIKRCRRMRVIERRTRCKMARIGTNLIKKRAPHLKHGRLKCVLKVATLGECPRTHFYLIAHVKTLARAFVIPASLESRKRSLTAWALFRALFCLAPLNLIVRRHSKYPLVIIVALRQAHQIERGKI